MSRGVLPRSLPVLLILLAAALVWLAVGGRGRSGDPTRARPIFAVDPGDVAVVSVQLADRSVELIREGEDWRLAGTVSDRGDPEPVAGLLDALTGELGSSDLSDGDEWRDEARRFGLGAFPPARVTVTTREGAVSSLSIGARNPATGTYYATGAGRDALFAIGGELPRRLELLPNGARHPDLWPPFHPLDIDSLTVRRGGGPADVFARDGAGRWWLRSPADGPARTGALHPRLIAAAPLGRVREDAGARWLRADDGRLANLLFFLDEAQVKRFDPVGAGAEDSLAGRPPWRELVWLRADFADGRPPQTLSLGPILPSKQSLARRGGDSNAFAIGPEIASYADAPLTDYLCLNVLTEPLAAADSLRVQFADSPPVMVRRSGEAWVADAGAAGDRSPGELFADLIHTMDRLAVAAVLPPAPSIGSPLGVQNHGEILAWYGVPGFPERVEIHVGIHGASRRAAAWSPATGLVAEVDPQILVTMRSLFIALGLLRR